MDKRLIELDANVLANLWYRKGPEELIQSNAAHIYEMRSEKYDDLLCYCFYIDDVLFGAVSVSDMHTFIRNKLLETNAVIAGRSNE